MTPRPSYSIPSYRIKLRITSSSVILVEGDQDKQAFRVLIAEARDAGWRLDRDVTIDAAESIIAGEEGVTNNREKVERVFEGLTDSLTLGRVVGFVDREYRGFDLEAPMDDIGAHYRVGRHVVWSRGHSIENYFFDYMTIRQTIRAVAVTERYDDAIRMLEAAFDDLLCLACAIGLAGREHNRLSMLSATIDPASIVISDLGVDMVNDVWFDKLLRQGCDQARARSIIDSYKAWRAKLAAVSLETVRWLCHGHIGFRVIWAAYGHCILFVGGDENERARAHRAPHRTWTDVSAHVWSQRAMTASVDWPEVVLRMMGFVSPPILDR
ncbi:MAG: hypothetical protein QOF01_4153 [Thermomicrobiales bacterium]|nr:hypothetical protein [Thermomicrobiales bacterium]